MAKLITKADEKKIENSFDAIINVLERSDLVLNKPDFLKQLQEKIENRNVLKREKDEKAKEYAERLQAYQKDCVKAFLSGFIDAQIDTYNPDLFGDMSFINRMNITNYITGLFVDLLCEPKLDYEKRMERRYYNRWYAKNVRRAKNKEKKQKCQQECNLKY